MRLCGTARRTVVLHGDFLDKNLLWNGARYVAIDPIPLVGEPCADVGFFAAGHRPATGILKRADAIAGVTSRTPRGLPRWRRTTGEVGIRFFVLAYFVRSRAEVQAVRDARGAAAPCRPADGSAARH
jgi:hypothetical protein